MSSAENDVKFSSKTASNYSSCGPSSGQQQPEIINSINKMELDQNIKNHAITCYNELASDRVDCKTKSVKGLNKASLVFYCVYIGFIRSENLVDPYYVADLIPLPPRKVNKALHRYIKPGCTLIEPETSLNFYISNINKHFAEIGFSFEPVTFNKEVRELLAICRSTKEGTNWIAETSSRIICITAIYFYLNDIKGFPVNKYEKLFHKAVYTSKASLKKYYTLFTHYYNLTEVVPIVNKNALPEIKKSFSALKLFDSDSDNSDDDSSNDNYD